MIKAVMLRCLLIKEVAFMLILCGLFGMLNASKQRTTVFIGNFAVKGTVECDSLNVRLSPALANMFKKSRDYMVVCASASDKYEVSGYVWEDKPYVYADAEVIDIERASVLVLSVGAGVVKYDDMQVSTVADSLAQILFDKIVFGLTKPVRIAISEFSMAGGDTICQSLKVALPAMLESALSVSSDVVLVEGSKDTLANRISEGYRVGYMYDPLTKYKYGKIMLPNYLIRGTFWEYGGKVRIDVICVNIETGEGIFGGGTVLPVVDIDEIPVKMGEFSTEILAGIMRDLNKAEARKTMAVVGLTPLPDTKDNRRYAKNIVREITRKLKTTKADKIRIKEDQAKIDSFMRMPTDKWKMASRLKVSRLLLIQLQNYGDGKIIIEGEIFDSEYPDSNFGAYIKPGNFREITPLTHRVVDSVLKMLGVDKDTNFKEDITIKRELMPYSFGIRYGTVITSVNGPLEIRTNQSFDLFFSAPLPFVNSEYLKIGGLITWNWGDRTWENTFLGIEKTSVHLLSAFMTFRYNHSPGERTNPYLDFGLGVLKLRRIKHEGDNLLDAPGYPMFGIAAIAGSEFFGNKSLCMTFQTKIWRGFGEVAADTVNNTIFKGGDLFGLDISLGFGFKW